MQEISNNQKLARQEYNAKNIERLKNKDYSIIASNCTGAFISHDLGLRFNAPTVNLFLYPDDFIKYVKNLEHYMKSKLTFIKEEGILYPIGLLDDIKIYFMHYKDEAEATQKWNDRTKRINLDNLFVMMSDRDGCTLENIKEFDELPLKHKVIFTNKEYPQFKSAFYIKGFEDLGHIGDVYLFKNENSAEKYYDDFDYVSWFNSALED